MAIILVAFSITMVKADWERVLIQQPQDDGVITVTGGKFFTQNWVGIKEPHTDVFAYIKFNSVDIPEGSNIDAAYIQLTAATPASYPQYLPVTVYGLKKGDQPNWLPTPDLNSQPQTAHFTNFDVVNLTSSNAINITVTGIVKEIYEQWAWVDGNPMAFRFASIAVSGGQRWFLSYESDPNTSAELFINYSAPIVNSTEWYKGFKIVRIPGAAGGAQAVATYYDSVQDEVFMLSFGDDGLLKTNHSLGVYAAQQWTEPHWMQWLTIGGRVYGVNKTGYFIFTDDYGLTWESPYARLTAMSIQMGQAYAYDQTNEIIHGVIHSSSDLYYFNLTISTGILSTPYKIRETGTWNSVQYMSLDVDDENANNDLIFAAAIQGGASSAWGVTFCQRDSNVWTSDHITWALSTPVHPVVRFLDDGDITIALDVQELGANNEGGIYVWDYGLADGLNSIDNWYTFPTGNGWFRNVMGVSGEAGNRDFYPWSFIRPNGQITTTWRTDANSTALFMLPSAYEIYKPYSTTNYYPRPQFVTDMFNQSGVYWNFLTGRVAVFTSDALDAGTYSTQYVHQASSGDHGFFTWKYGTAGGSGLTMVNAEKSQSVIQAANEAPMIRGNTGLGLSWSTWVYTTGSSEGTYEVFNGTDPAPFNTTCLDLAVTLEDIKACLDEIVGQTGDDPNPPGTTYPPDGFGQITRFNMRYYLWIIGQICVFAPVLAMAYRKYDINMYGAFFIVIMIGLGLLWSLSSI